MIHWRQGGGVSDGNLGKNYTNSLTERGHVTHTEIFQTLGIILKHNSHLNIKFSKESALRPILSQSRDVCVSVPFLCKFFQASHQPSCHMIRSRPSRWQQYSENENIHQEMYIITTGNPPPPPQCRAVRCRGAGPADGPQGSRGPQDTQPRVSAWSSVGFSAKV